MINKFLLIGLLCLCYGTTSAQLLEEDKKKFNHFIGVQGNDLLKQLLNLSGSNTPINNPFLFTYQLTNNKSMWGARSGAGYETSNIEDQLDAFTRRTTKIEKISAKVGVEKTVTLGGGFAASFGLDVAYNLNNNNSSNKFVNFDTAIISIINKTTTISTGPGVRLVYYVSSRFALGTETNFWVNFNTLNNKTITEIKPGPFGGFGTYLEESFNSKNIKVNTMLPAAVYLILRL